jgi:hypothetical protein
MSEYSAIRPAGFPGYFQCNNSLILSVCACVWVQVRVSFISLEVKTHFNITFVSPFIGIYIGENVKMFVLKNYIARGYKIW